MPPISHVATLVVVHVYLKAIRTLVPVAAARLTSPDEVLVKLPVDNVQLEVISVHVALFGSPEV